MNRNYSIITFILGRLRVTNFAASSKLQPSLLKQPLKTEKMLKELEICIRMQSIFLFLDIARVADFWQQNGSGTQGVYHVTLIFFRS